MMQIEAFFGAVILIPLYAFFTGLCIFAFAQIAKLFSVFAWLIPFNWTIWKIFWWGYGFFGLIIAIGTLAGHTPDPNHVGPPLVLAYFASLMGLVYLRHLGWYRIRGGVRSWAARRRDSRADRV
jgi:hypothetical protein